MKRKKAQRHCVLFREFCTDIPPSVQRLSTPLNKVKRPDNFDRSTPDALAQWLDGYLESLTVRNYAAQTVEHRRYTLKLFLAWAILELFYSCGLRRTELCRLELSSFHAERRTLHVRGKGNKDRMVPVGWRAVQWLERYLTEVRPRLCLDTRTQALFLTGYGDAFNPDVLSRMVRRV